MDHIADEPTEAAGLSRRTKWFVAWTVCSALAVWLGLSVAEGLAAERCTIDGLSWDWKAWTCAQPRGTIILPSSLRRAGKLSPGLEFSAGTGRAWSLAETLPNQLKLAS